MSMPQRSGRPATCRRGPTPTPLRRRCCCVTAATTSSLAGPTSWSSELAHADHRVERALRNHARRRYGSAAAQHRLVVRFALVHLPEAAVRATAEPGRLIDAVGAAALAVLRSHRVAA